MNANRTHATFIGNHSVSLLASLAGNEGVLAFLDGFAALLRGSQGTSNRETLLSLAMDRQVDAGLKLENFARIWIHTHPGGSLFVRTLRDSRSS